METLRLKNEKTVAVGNMRVNARGEEISPTTGQVIKTRESRMSEHYKLHTTVPAKRKKNQTKTTTETVEIATHVPPVTDAVTIVQSYGDPATQFQNGDEE
jgi:hypothetical protein